MLRRVWSVVSSDAFLTRLKTALAIIAIPVAAWWAFTRFTEGERPSLEQRAEVQGELFWHEHSASDCLAEYRVTIKNIGKTSFDVAEAHVRVWTFPDPGPFKNVFYVDPLSLTKGSPLIDQTITGNLVGHYAPDVASSLGISFGVERKVGTLVVFSFGANPDKGDQPRDKPDRWNAYRFDYTCGEPAPEPSKTKPAH